MRRFYAPVSSFSGNVVSLDEDETRHLRDVLRLRPGDEVYVIDGEGREFKCSVRTINKRETTLAIIEAGAPQAAESPLYLTLAVAVLKGDKFDLVIQKAVELGVTRLVPLETERCDVKLKDAARKLERWNRIVLEASKQSGRGKLMKIEPPSRLSGLFDDRASHGATIMFAESGGQAFPASIAGNMITGVIGPAGGWTAEELELARTGGAVSVTLGKRILRAETAAIAAASILQHRFGDLN
jgi:16S rRNA (uracil1498-N3)-methyltransferase